jgi:hypothetical protein
MAAPVLRGRVTDAFLPSLGSKMPRGKFRGDKTNQKTPGYWVRGGLVWDLTAADGRLALTKSLHHRISIQQLPGCPEA